MKPDFTEGLSTSSSMFNDALPKLHGRIGVLSLRSSPGPIGPVVRCDRHSLPEPMYYSTGTSLQPCCPVL